MLLFPRGEDVVVRRVLSLPHSEGVVVRRVLSLPHSEGVVVERVLLLPHSEDVVVTRVLLFPCSDDVTAKRVLLLPCSDDVALRSVAWQFHRELSKVHLDVLMMMERVLVLPHSMELSMLQLFGMPSKPTKVPDFVAQCDVLMQHIVELQV